MTETQTTKTTTKSYSPCFCGCGFLAGGKSLYKRGHDAKHVSVLLSYIAAGTHTVDEAKAALPSPALRVKLHNALARQARRQEAKANKAPRKPRMVEPREMASEVKVGRWWYPIVDQTAGQITYTKRDGSEATTSPDAETR